MTEKVIQEQDNVLLKRKEIKILVEADKTPSFAEAEKVIIEKYKVDKENLVVNGINSKFGRNTFLINAYIYNTKEDKEHIEPKAKKKDKAGEAATPEQPAVDVQDQQQAAEPAEEKQEEKAEEKPVEENKSEGDK